MERDLQEICALEHVGGAFVCDNAGEVIVSSTPPVLATITMNQISRAAAQTFGAMETAKKLVERLEFTYDTWRRQRTSARDATAGRRRCFKTERKNRSDSIAKLRRHAQAECKILKWFLLAHQ